MDLKQIEKLMIAMRQSQIKRIILKKEDFEIEIESEPAVGATPPSPQPSYASEAHQLVTPSMAILPKVIVESQHPTAPQKGEGYYITSPMVGTFYSAPSPDDPSFVKVGDTVSESSVVCIIEAMKVMNEVKAGISGTVAEILLKNGEPVEFGSNMFRIIPA